MGGMSEPKPLGSTSLIRLVAGREISTRLRDKNFLISTAVLLILIIGVMVFQVLVNTNASKSTIGVVGGSPTFTSVLRTQADEARGASIEEFVHRFRARLEAEAGAETSKMYVQAAQPEHQYLGLDRYWSLRKEA